MTKKRPKITIHMYLENDNLNDELMTIVEVAGTNHEVMDIAEVAQDAEILGEGGVEQVLLHILGEKKIRGVRTDDHMH